MKQHPLSGQAPMIGVQGGVLRSMENHVAVVRSLGFDTSITYTPVTPAHPVPVTVLVENIRGYEIEVLSQGGNVHNIIRSDTLFMFDIPGSTKQYIRLRYRYPPTEFDFFFLGDLHGVFRNFQRIIDRANVLDPLFMVANGDITHSGRVQEYHTFANLLDTCQVPCFTSIGNHDRRLRGSRGIYRKMLAPMYYSFEVAGTTFIILDSSRKRGLQRAQYRWLERELQRVRNTRVIVILHRPPVCPKYEYLSFAATTNIKRFLSLMEAYQVDLVLGSHVHVFTEFTRRRVRYVISGGGGGALWQPSNVYHYLHIFVRKDGIEIKKIQLPTPEANVGQRLKDAIALNVHYYFHRTKMFQQASDGHASGEYRRQKRFSFRRDRS